MGCLGVRTVSAGLRLVIDERSAVVNAGIASEDGSSGQVGPGVVTPERIPLLFYEEGRYINVIFERQ